MTAAYTIESCKERLKKAGLSPIANPIICAEAKKLSPVHTMCKDQPVGTPVSIIICENRATGQQVFDPEIITVCTNLHDQDPNWGMMAAYCCCFLADATAAQTIPRATLRRADGAPHLTWTEARLDMVQALETAVGETVLIRTDGAPGEAIVGAAQPVLLHDGQFVLAEHLAPGDRLLSAESHPLTVLAVGHGHEAPHPPSLSFEGELAPHERLYSIGGLVVGDFTVQADFHGLEADMKAPPRAKEPAEGLPVRLAGGGTFRMTSSEGADPAFSRTVSHMFTPKQAQDILANGDLLPANDPVVKDRVRRSISLLKGFYPAVSITYDDTSMNANIDGRQKCFWSGLDVYLHGGLARQKALQEEGLLMALCHCIAAFGEDPSHPDSSISCVAEADFSAFGYYARNIWSPASFLPNSQAALAQWKTLFDLVSPAHGSGDPVDPCAAPSLDCRYESAQVGFVGGNQPACGKPRTYLELDKLEVLQAALIALHFSEPLDPALADDVANYDLTPGISVVSAGIPKSDPKAVVLTLDQRLDDSTLYTLTVSNLKSYGGDKLSPDPTVQTFSYPPYQG
ncbi:Ig-like domain-containing protein [Breoghania sp.]|uniref:Ig-like domain-containing protein n=1 Tax=Breoghania sp. TaxID=2065378 RepID=UPI002AAAE20C|nr:Ig-like domain-containing protein [Breoghania sp.]